jgi:hypothetical protein
MDDIDRYIEQGKIGKKDEELQGWDHIKPKQPVIPLPPMEAIDKRPHKKHQNKHRSNLGYYAIFLIALVVIGTKLIGMW